MAERKLTAAERERNVQRMRDAERRLGEIEQRLAHHAYETARLLRDVRHERGEIRAVFGMTELPALAPAFTKPAVSAKRQRGKVRVDGDRPADGAGGVDDGGGADGG